VWPNQASAEKSRRSSATTREASRSSQSCKGTVCSDEALRFAMESRADVCKRTPHSSKDYPQLALVVRAIKYLGIYRHEAQPKCGASREGRRVRRTVLMDGWSIAEPLTNLIASLFHQLMIAMWSAVSGASLLDGARPCSQVKSWTALFSEPILEPRSSQGQILDPLFAGPSLARVPFSSTAPWRHGCSKRCSLEILKGSNLDVLKKSNLEMLERSNLEMLKPNLEMMHLSWRRRG
jgi:hypothetical protein